MNTDETDRRGVLGAMAAALPLTALLARMGEASAQPAAGGTAPAGTSPVRVDTKGLVARIKFEEVISGFLEDLNGRFKLRVTELILDPGGHVGEHNHVGPGIRQVTVGQMTYVMPERTVVYNQGDFFFESGDVNHTAYNRTDAPMVHVLFEILPVDLKGPSLIPVRHH